MKILTVIGARPQFIKAAMVCREIKTRLGLDEIIVHTGQHVDANMSGIFFDELSIPMPDYNLGINGLHHGAMTGRMLESIEVIIKGERPDWILVYGDTNSTLAAALAAVKLQVKVAHVEAGLRSHNFNMPEEINRVITDRISTYLLCPTQIAIDNLIAEGFPFQLRTGLTQKINNVGDVMYDAALYYREQARKRYDLTRWGLAEKTYVLCTLHRQENTDNPERLKQLLESIASIANDFEVVFPLHPRTRNKIWQHGYAYLLNDIHVMEPVPYLIMQRLLMSARVLLTDSGGLQKEAYFHRVPCITLRNETEWLETVSSGCNKLAKSNFSSISEWVNDIDACFPGLFAKNFASCEGASGRIVDALVMYG